MLLIYCLATGYPFCHHNILDIKENNQRGLELRTTVVCFFLVLEMMLTSTSLIVVWFPDHTSIPKFHTSNYRIQQIWFIISALQKVQTQFLRRTFCSSDSSFGTIFAQTFLMFNSSIRIVLSFVCYSQFACKKNFLMIFGSTLLHGVWKKNFS